MYSLENNRIVGKGKRNPVNWLMLSLRHAQEYLKELIALRKKHSDTEIQTSKRLLIIHRALWTSLIAEVRKLFDNSRFPNYSLRKIDYFTKEPHKTTIDKIYRSKIILRIINTGNSFTLHLGEEETEIVGVKEICESNLGELLDELNKPIDTYWKSQK